MLMITMLNLLSSAVFLVVAVFAIRLASRDMSTFSISIKGHIADIDYHDFLFVLSAFASSTWSIASQDLITLGAANSSNAFIRELSAFTLGIYAVLTIGMMAYCARSTVILLHTILSSVLAKPAKNIA